MNRRDLLKTLAAATTEIYLGGCGRAYAGRLSSVLLVGDSIAWEYARGLGPALGNGVVLRNCAVPGLRLERAASLLRSILAEGRTFDAVVLSVGLNDVRDAKGIVEVRRGFQACIAIACQLSKKVFYSSLTPVVDSRVNENAQAFNDLLRGLTSRLAVVYVESGEFVDTLEGNIWLDDELHLTLEAAVKLGDFVADVVRSEMDIPARRVMRGK